MATVPFIAPSHFPANTRAAFFTRQGGVSEGVFASLNSTFAKMDNPNHVRENRRRVCAALGLQLENLITIEQVHGDAVVVVDGPFKVQPKADAMITNVPNIILGIQTADCVPILLADLQTPWVGAIHAGWKSAQLGIIKKTVRMLNERGATHLVAAIGPCIWQESYEVTEEFLDYFPSQFFKPGKNAKHFFFDLSGVATCALQESGLETIIPSPGNTFSDEDRFYSNRRRVLRGETAFGNLLSVIVRCP